MVALMNLRRVAIFSALAAAGAAVLAGAMTSGRGESAIVPMASAPAVELQGAELAEEIARLRDRLRPTSEPRLPARNLFRFGTLEKPAIDSVALDQPVMTASPALPPLKLVGIAEDPGTDGPVRTAILSGLGELFLAEEGETVALRYRVAQISSGGVVLTDLTDQTEIHLSFR